MLLNRLWQSVTRTGLPFPRGALYDKEGLPPGLPKGADLIHIDTEPKRADSPYCNDRVRAVSNRPNKLLILCYKSTMPAPMKPRPEFPKEVTVGKLLDDVTDWALPTTWIHEMGHYVMGWPEPKVHEGGTSHDVYSWDLTTTLAKTNKEQSLQSPEAFALFATTMWFDQWYWGSGAAKAKPGYEHTPPPSPPESAFQNPNDPFKTVAEPPVL
ncbi:hypothetical protein HII31_05446 [Pseudocercospora fuligena]|uniref:Uncharacterized protein n=1 Tax=Pseudocercospora fuligena TaxID=685502 RepID=A0A8H6VNJ6_9PEZI|nr:hypothetical protein HII31_05446 [Pseudocercospora fuligena]